MRLPCADSDVNSRSAYTVPISMYLTAQEQVAAIVNIYMSYILSNYGNEADFTCRHHLWK